jgi:hypothetical protein
MPEFKTNAVTVSLFLPAVPSAEQPEAVLR